MQYLLSRDSRPVLKQLANERTLCAFDFDGTLSPIVSHPIAARMRRRTSNLLGRLVSRYPCIVISGRARADVLNRLNGVRVARVIGNHGAEIGRGGKRVRRLVAQWKSALELRLPPIPGLWVEDKGLSLAVHYRQSPKWNEARRRVLEVVRTLPGIRVFGGKCVVNLVEEGAPHKGDVLDAERKRLRCNWVLYVGDDENDEDAFALAGNVISVRIGAKRNSGARYYLRTQTEIDSLLELLFRIRLENENPSGSSLV